MLLALVYMIVDRKVRTCEEYICYQCVPSVQDLSVHCSQSGPWMCPYLKDVAPKLSLQRGGTKLFLSSLPFLPPDITAEFGSYLSSLTLYRQCGLA
jgi:hypothetical protein